MKTLNDKFVLSNGVEVPCIGYGTWQIPNGEAGVNLIVEAFKQGYRHIDTAAIYENEEIVGKAIKRSGLKREDLFITSKLWNTERGYDSALKAFDVSLKKLQLDYLDLYLIHWPAVKPANWKDINTQTWTAFEELYRDKKIRSIGVSNFKRFRIKCLMQSVEIMPHLNQLEFHPGFMQLSTVEFCKSTDVVVSAWGPLANGKILDNSELRAIASRYNKSVAQLCIRWCLQHEVLPLPKSSTKQRMIENANVFDFSISAADMEAIDNLPFMGGSNLDPDKIDF
ncbi:MAG: aldo/keto reductase [Bacteroidales bacterium]|jgi:diketogulonate reductase-like aldo/keto reductase|nr:aldo/keto reductase [Bacteroidales bacterium]